MTRFLYDGVNNLKDYDEDWEPVASYVQGIGIDKLISRKDTNGPRYFHADALGSTRLMTDATQASTAAYTYDAWGKVTAQTGETANKYKFTAREWEDEIKLQYNRARFYDPETGRFITQDPLTKGPDDPTIAYYSGVYSIIHRYVKEYIDALQPDKTNRYVYCYNNPINFTDPLGLDADEDKVKGVGEAAKAEQKGDTKAEEAGKSDKTGTEQKGKTSEDIKRDQGVETQQQSGKSSIETSKPEETKRETPRPEPVPCPSPAPVDTRSPQQEAVSKNLEAKGGLPQRGLAQELHETLQPTGKGSDIITWVAVPLLFAPGTTIPTAAALAITTSNYAGLAAKLGDAAVTKDAGKAAWAVGEWFVGLAAGRAAVKLSGLESASFNWGSMRFHSETSGQFISGAAGKTSNAVRYSAETAVSVPLAVSEYKKPETP